MEEEAAGLQRSRNVAGTLVGWRPVGNAGPGRVPKERYVGFGWFWSNGFLKNRGFTWLMGLIKDLKSTSNNKNNISTMLWSWKRSKMSQDVLCMAILLMMHEVRHLSAKKPTVAGNP